MNPEEEKVEIETEAVATPPAINVTLPDSVVTGEDLLGIYGEILTKLRNNDDQTSDLIDKFANFVLNEGDATTSSKEALVNLIKIKTDLADKMAKIAELMTRVNLKDPWPRYLTAKKDDDSSGSKTTRREMLKQIEIDKKNKG